MKLILPVLILISIQSNGQKVEISSADGMAQFQKIIEFDSTSTHITFDKVNRWVMSTFNSPKDVLSGSIQNEEIKGKGYQSDAISLSGLTNGDLQYFFRVDIKPSKVRITIYSMTCIFKNAVYSIETYVLKKDGTFRKNGQASDVIEGATRTANRLINSLENSIFSAPSKKDDW